MSTSQTKTIGRNATKQIAAIKAKNLVCEVFTLENYFIAEVVDPATAWSALDRFPRTKLTFDGERYTIRVHSNCWFRLYEAK